MATGAKKSQVNLWLIASLGILIVIGILVAISNKKEASDPTLTAAPPIVATPGHPIAVLRASPEVMALKMKEIGTPVPAGASRQPAAKP